MRIIHVLEWMINDVTNNLEHFKQHGFDTVQISPLHPCKGDKWWGLYQPFDFIIGNRLSSKDDFIKLCTKAKEFNIKIIVDVVLRHFAGDDYGNLVPHKNCNQEIVNDYQLWLDFKAGDHHNRYDIINRCFGMPSFNYFNPKTQDMYFKYLDEILLYADGIRIDMAKHFALPSEGCDFLPKLSERYNGKIIYGECINLEQHLLDEYSKYMLTLVEKNAGGNNGDNSVVFFESHDTYLGWKYTVNITDTERINKWNDLKKEYKNTLYYARPFDKTLDLL